MQFALPFQNVAQLKKIVGSISPDRYGLVIRSNSEELARVAGGAVYGVMQYIQQLKTVKGG